MSALSRHEITKAVEMGSGISRHVAHCKCGWRAVLRNAETIVGARVMHDAEIALLRERMLRRIQPPPAPEGFHLPGGAA